VPVAAIQSFWSSFPTFTTSSPVSIRTWSTPPARKNFQWWDVFSPRLLIASSRTRGGF
jgi:hypothetical protein